MKSPSPFGHTKSKMTRKNPATTRTKAKKPPKDPVATAVAHLCHGARAARMPSIVHPMLATLVDDPFSNPEWIFETKWDGFRALCFIQNGNDALSRATNSI